MVLVPKIMATCADFPTVFTLACVQQSFLHNPLHLHVRVMKQRRRRNAAAQFFDIREMLSPVLRTAHTQLFR